MSHEIPVGSHLVSPRTLYSHHGIYVGNGKVVHYSGLADRISTGPVIEVTLAQFVDGNGYSIKEHSNPKFSSEEIVLRARSRIGEKLYSVFANNCEHFCEWCINNDHDSTQVTKGTVVASPTGGTISGIAARSVVAASGSVAGLSGSGVMSGLGTIGTLGGLVEGGVGATVGLGAAMSGIAIAGAIPGLATASLVNNTILSDNPAHTQDERDSRTIGRAASYVGVAAGTAGSIAAVSAAGTTAGLSAAGITTGLAAIGATVGGGMASGVVIVTAAPVAAAVAVGYGVYKFVKWFKD